MENYVDVKKWPFNLIKDVVEEEEFYYVYIPGFMDAIETLTEREQKVLKYKYADHMTYDKIGSLVGGVGGSRVMQIKNKACRKLKIGRSRRNLYLTTLMANLKDLEQKKESVQRELDLVYEHLGVGDEHLGVGAPVKLFDAITIDELNLSVRSYNCLKRAGILTFGDLKGVDTVRLMKIRNLGVKSFEEIYEAAKNVGIVIR